MSGFTKGTWKYLDAINQVCAYDEAAKWPNDWPKDITGELSWNGSEEEIHANGRLIAAAPEMYELMASLANLPDEQCMISPLIHEARRLMTRIDDTEVTYAKADMDR